MIETLVALISVAGGVALKATWDAYVDKKKTIELEIWKIRVVELEKRLSQFYWPIYLRLQRDNVVWKRILERDDESDTERQRLAYQIEEGVLLPNHIEVVKIIESSIHLAALDKEFENLLFAYLRHIDVYRSIRTVGIKDKDPIYFNEPYPTEFFPALEKRLMRYQQEYDAALRDQSVG